MFMIGVAGVQEEVLLMKKKNYFRLMVIIVFINLVLFNPSVYAEDTFLIKAEKLYTVNQGIISNGMILIKDGKIAQVGENIPVSEDTKVWEGKVILPGLIDMHSHLGVYSLPRVEENADGNEATDPLTPQVRALDSFNFDDPALRAGLAGGVTTIVSRPGSANVIGGTSVAVKLKKARPQEMIIKEICDLKMAIEGNPVGVYGGKKRMPSSLMAVYYLARKAFLDAQEYQEKWENYKQKKEQGKEISPPPRDLGKEVLLKALKREIPVHIHCATASEMMSCIRLAEEFDLRLSLGHCYWAYLVVEELKKHQDVYYNIGPPMFFNYFENPLTFKNNPAILAEAGLKVSLQTDALGGTQKNLRHLASLCVRYGMKEEDALKAITLYAAEAVGLDNRLGSIEEGKDADLVFLDGEPFEFMTSVEKVMIDGRIEYSNPHAGNKENLETQITPAQRELSIPSGFKECSQFALKGGTIFTIEDPPFKNGVVLIKDEKIEKVGSDILIPSSYKVINVQDFVIMPGLVSPRSFVGISSNWRRQSSINEPSQPIVPQLQVKHALEPQAPHFSFCREMGITTALVTPGNMNVMGGQGCVVKTHGSVMDNMVFKDNAVMMFGLGVSAKRKNEMPSTRMGIASLMRENLIKAQEYKAKKERFEKEGKEEKFNPDLTLEALIPVLDGERPVMIHCERKDDILTALRIADEFKLNIILDGATDAYKVLDEIKERNISVVLGDLFRGAGNIEDKGFNPQNPALLAEAEIPVSFRIREGSWYTPGAGGPGGDLLETAAFAVKNGMSVEDALKAVTITAARIAGVEERVGSIAEGKDADILILRGHPLKVCSIPEAVFVSGKLVYQREKGKRMNRIK